MRTSIDICLLCQNNKADKTNSHFLPASLLQTNIGRRDYEEAYSIDVSSETPTIPYYGRSNLKNTDPTIKQNPHTSDHIFCSDCEAKLAQLESENIPQLKNHLENQNEVDELTITSFNPTNTNSFTSFIYSIIWRFNLQIKLKQAIDILPSEIENNLRVNIHQYCENSSFSAPHLPFSIFSTAGEYLRDENPVGFDEFFIKHIFLANEIHILPIFDGNPMINTKFEDIISHYQNKDVLSSRDSIKIGIVPLEKWQKYYKQLYDKKAFDFKMIRIEELQKFCGNSFDELDNELKSRAKKIIGDKEVENFSDYYHQAFTEMLNEINRNNI